MRKITKFKLTIIFIAVLVVASMVGCSNYFMKEEEVENSINYNISSAIEYKDSFIGDNSAIVNIVLNLPGEKYYDEIELRTDKEPYGVEIKYRAFEEATIKLENGTILTFTKDQVLKGNAIVMFALIQNLDIIRFTVDDGTIEIFKRADLEEEYKNETGNELESIVVDTNSIEEFYSNIK